MDWRKFLSGFAFWKGEQLGKILWVSVICIGVIFGAYKLFLQRTIGTQTFGKVRGDAQEFRCEVKPFGCGGFWIRR